MRHSLYVPARRFVQGTRTGGAQAPGSAGGITGDRADKVLRALISSALKKYRGDLEKSQEIREKVGMFEINRTIARDLGSKTSEKKLEKDLIQYLKNI